MPTFKRVWTYYSATNPFILVLALPVGVLSDLLFIAGALLRHKAGPDVWSMWNSWSGLTITIGALYGAGACVQFLLDYIHCYKVDRFRDAASQHVRPLAYQQAVQSWVASVDVLFNGQRWRGTGASIIESTYALEDRTDSFFYEASVLCRTPEGAWFGVHGRLDRTLVWRPVRPESPIQPLQVTDAQNALASVGVTEYSRFFGDPPLAR